MRKIVLSIMVSVDGYIAGPEDDLEWFVSDAELEEEMLTLLSSVDAMVFGRRAYELLAEFWPTASSPDSSSAPGGISTPDRQAEFARLMNTIDKLVVSTTLTTMRWGPGRILSGDMATEVAALRSRAGGDIVVFAGAEVARTFLRAGVVDELHLQVAPTVLGAGKPLFGPDEPRSLRLLRARAFPSGVVLTHYAVDAGTG